MNKCFLAYFDILGYGNRIGKKRVTGEYNIHKKFVDRAKFSYEKINNEISSEKISYIHFSDTHVFYTADNSEYSFGSIVLSSLRFMILSAISPIPYLPVRGSICYGNFIADKENNIYVGKALREAYDLERKQDWLGCCLSHKCIEKAKNFGVFAQFKEKGLLVEYQVPLKKRRNYLSYTINMESFVRVFGKESKEMPITNPKFWENIFINKGLNNSDRIKLKKEDKLKLENTKKFYNYIEKIQNQFGE